MSLLGLLAFAEWLLLVAAAHLSRAKHGPWRAGPFVIGVLVLVTAVASGEVGVVFLVGGAYLVIETLAGRRPSDRVLRGVLAVVGVGGLAAGIALIAPA